MSDDERALLASVTAHPADDTARLVYADWLDEHGNSVRAAFIRVQIEAERLHQDSLRRAQLIGRAEELFAEHWIDWWAPVCAAVGLPAPQRSRTTRLGRFAQRVGLVRDEGQPFVRQGGSVIGPVATVARLSADSLPTVWHVEFRRGFPGSPVPISILGGAASPGDLIRRWASAAPLDRLRAANAAWQEFDGPHLAPLPSLTVSDQWLASAIVSPHLTGLTEFRWEPEGYSPESPREIGRIASAPFAPRLRQLAVPVPDDESARALARAAFDRLTSLAITLDFEVEEGGGQLVPPPENDRSRLAILAGSSRLAGLEELDVSATLTPAGVRAVVCGPRGPGFASSPST